ncbi:permease [Paraburkholderia kirstenboschensis]|uniref:permease n=1 Tax=Paraburkholderia kirstenboschensis TaxID=1245436 RepID=UPI000A4783B6|nr:permease [Paraburkholderia kirstenboschensis]
MEIVTAVGHALWMAFTMLWQIFWGLSLGFLFSAVIEVVVSKSEMSKLLPDASPRSLTVASLLGAASSSCSYAAVAMARSIVRKGGDFTSAMAFQFAATNLVLELGVLMWVLISWQFAAAEFIGGPIMIVVLVLLFRFFLSDSLKSEAIEQANKGIAGSMEGHAAMSMGEQHGTWKQRLISRDGWIAISHSYVMNWAMLWRDIAIGLLVAGALGAWVPDSFWQNFSLSVIQRRR